MQNKKHIKLIKAFTNFEKLVKKQVKTTHDKQLVYQLVKELKIELSNL